MVREARWYEKNAKSIRRFLICLFICVTIILAKFYFSPRPIQPTDPRLKAVNDALERNKIPVDHFTLEIKDHSTDNNGKRVVESNNTSTSEFEVSYDRVNNHVYVNAKSVSDLGAGIHWYLKRIVGGSVNWEANGGNADFKNLIARNNAEQKLLQVGDISDSTTNESNKKQLPSVVQLRSKISKNINSLVQKFPTIKTKDENDKVESYAMSTDLTNRYYFNICTYGYSTAFWDWARWEQELDWMLFQGINMPLSVLGLEYVWHDVFTKDFKMSSADALKFLGGPAFIPWRVMGNEDSWGGPLTEMAMNKGFDYQKKFLKRNKMSIKSGPE